MVAKEARATQSLEAWWDPPPLEAGTTPGKDVYFPVEVSVALVRFLACVLRAEEKRGQSGPASAPRVTENREKATLSAPAFPFVAM